MKIRVETPVEYPQVLKEFGVQTVSREWAKYLIPSPYYNVPLNKFPRLEIIATPSTGTNHIDLNECQKRNIKVLSLLDDRDALSEIRASSEFAFWMVMSGLRTCGWRQWRTYQRDYEHMLGRELYGKHVGILGFGRIGRNVAKWLSAFDATWQSYDYGSSPETLQEIFENCDVILISMTLNPKSEGLITKDLLSRTKPDAILVNVSRAEIIVEQDLYEWAAQKGRYVTDVMHHEVSGGHLNSPLLSNPNCIVYPHLAGHTLESNEKALRIALRLLEREITKKK